MQHHVLRQTLKSVLILGMLFILFSSFSPSQIHAQGTILVVNTTSSSIICNGSTCSLSGAIAEANLGGVDAIHFNVPGSGPHEITVNDPLRIRKSVIIDATTQPGYAGTPLIFLKPFMSAPNYPQPNNCFYVEDGYSYDAALSVTIRGLAIGGFTRASAILLGNGRGHLIENNFIGTDVTGMISKANQGGVSLRARESIIRNNLIASNEGDAMTFISNAGRLSMDNVIQGNIIGMNLTKTVTLPNNRGIIIDRDVLRMQIGGVNPGEGNIISGNKTAAIEILGRPETILGEHVIEGNIITNNGSGILSTGSSHSRIGGTEGVTPGGACTGACNLISGNTVALRVSENAVVQGNYIGTDITGMLAFSNGRLDYPESNYVVGVSNNSTLGGTTPEARNIIAGNIGIGIRVGGTGSTIQGNYIGVATDGITPMGNTHAGVRFDNTTHDNLLGGTDPTMSNIIAYNGGDGVLVQGVTSALLAYNNRISGNRIFGNGKLGINLLAYDDPGVNPNDPGDGDEHGNMGQNYPVLSLNAVDLTAVSGILNSASDTTYRIELYFNEACDQIGHGEGQMFLTAFDVMTNSGGIAAFNHVLAQALSGGQSVTATATDPFGNTSEFSNCVQEVGPGFIPAANMIYTGAPNVFQWERGFEPVTRYRLQVRDAQNKQVVNMAFTPAVICNVAICRVNVRTQINPGVKLKQNATYTWRVSTTIESITTNSPWLSFTNRVLPKPITLISPAASEQVMNSRPTFTWQYNENVGNYRLVITNTLTGTIVVNRAIGCYLIDTQCSYEFAWISPPSELANGSYNWQLKATSSQVIGSSKSVKSPFTVQFPGKPTLGEPEKNEIVSTQTPTFTWSEVALANEYRLVLVEQKSGKKLLDGWRASGSYGLLCEDTTCTFTPQSPLPLKNGLVYTWHVQTRNTSVSTNVSKSAKFPFKVNFGGALESTDLRQN